MQAAEVLLGLSEESIDRIFQNVDKQGNNKIDFREFAQAALDTRILLKEDNLQRTFMALDFDQDGEIDSNDLRQVFGDCVCQIDDERWAQITNKVDADGDGKIQFEEFKAYMTRLMHDEFVRTSTGILAENEEEANEEG